MQSKFNYLFIIILTYNYSFIFYFSEIELLKLEIEERKEREKKLFDKNQSLLIQINKLTEALTEQVSISQKLYSEKHTNVHENKELKQENLSLIETLKSLSEGNSNPQLVQHLFNELYTIKDCKY